MKFIRAAGKNVVRRLTEPPWESNLMEFKYGVWSGVSPLFTESGRQLGEENARPFLFNDHIPAKKIACKYEGSRNGREINMSALRIAMINYDAALEITKAVIRYHAAAVTRKNPNAVGGTWDLYIIALASISLISYSVRKQPAQRKPAIVADDLASQYQFIAGIFMICRHMIDTEDGFIIGNNPIDAKQLYDYADQHEIFTSFNGMVCAGSTKKIMDFLEFCTGEMTAELSKPSATSQQDTYAPLDRIVDDVDQWYRYAVSAIELDCFVKIERRMHKLKNGLSSDLNHQTVIDTYKNISDYGMSLMQSADNPLESAYEAGSLQRQNRLLEMLNRKPIKKIDKKYLNEQYTYD